MGFIKIAGKGLASGCVHLGPGVVYLFGALTHLRVWCEAQRHGGRGGYPSI